MKPFWPYFKTPSIAVSNDAPPSAPPLPQPNVTSTAAEGSDPLAGLLPPGVELDPRGDALKLAAGLDLVETLLTGKSDQPDLYSRDDLSGMSAGIIPALDSVGATWAGDVFTSATNSAGHIAGSIGGALDGLFNPKK